MLTINLTDLEKSDIKYKISTFPDGQQNITINPISLTGYLDTDGPTEYWAEKKISVVEIKARLNNWLNLELIVATVASLRELGIKKIHLYVPYFLGARSDRKFEEGGNWYLKQVICPIINSLNLKVLPF
jgi:phosphoribosylpyrophosphate synthetase